MPPNNPIKCDLDEANEQVAQMAALDALFEANRGEGSAARAMDLAKEARDLLSPPETIEELAVDVALAHILEEEPKGSLPETSDEDLPWFNQAVEEVCLAWVHWVARQDKRALGLPARLRNAAPSQDSGALSLPAIYDWARAVEALVEGDLVECRRFFERASEVSAQVGLETHTTLLWTYGATFFSIGLPCHRRGGRRS